MPPEKEEKKAVPVGPARSPEELDELKKSIGMGFASEVKKLLSLAANKNALAWLLAPNILRSSLIRARLGVPWLAGYDALPAATLKNTLSLDIGALHAPLMVQALDKAKKKWEDYCKLEDKVRAYIVARMMELADRSDASWSQQMTWGDLRGRQSDAPGALPGAVGRLSASAPARERTRIPEYTVISGQLVTGQFRMAYRSEVVVPQTRRYVASGHLKIGWPEVKAAAKRGTAAVAELLRRQADRCLTTGWIFDHSDTALPDWTKSHAVEDDRLNPDCIQQTEATEAPDFEALAAKIVREQEL